MACLIVAVTYIFYSEIFSVFNCLNSCAYNFSMSYVKVHV
jgi:hypothetical protein